MTGPTGRSESVVIRSADGLRLQGAVDAPPASDAVAVVCHPHPQLGGTMNAPLLAALRDELLQRRWAVVRFNFRGVGESEGRAGTGLDEVADVRGALGHALDRFTGAPCALCGWSFGAAVALRACAERLPVSACAAIAPAVLVRPGVTAGLPPLAEMGIAVPVLVVCGGNDEIIPVSECRSWAAGSHARVVEIRGANHFFWGRYDPLSATVADWLDGKHGAST